MINKYYTIIQGLQFSDINSDLQTNLLVARFLERFVTSNNIMTTSIKRRKKTQYRFDIHNQCLVSTFSKRQIDNITVKYSLTLKVLRGGGQSTPYDAKSRKSARVCTIITLFYKTNIPV